MTPFDYRAGLLHAEDVPLPKIVADVGTPFYVYASSYLTHQFHLLQEALEGLPHLICFSVKSNSNQAVLKTLAGLGAGMDVVSGGEYARAIAAGVPGERIVFSGVGKTAQEMRAALVGGIRHFNVESRPEMEMLNSVAVSLGTVAPVALRVNPNVDAHTGAGITTGKKDNKFGIPISRIHAAYAHAASLPGLETVGLDVHIGSQITDLAPFEKTFNLIADLVRQLRADGYTVRRLDLGGGLGVTYVPSDPPPPSAASYGALVKRCVGDLGLEQVEIEPGRFVSANAGLLVSKVIYVKPEERRTFLILDAGMNDLLRPALYGSYHDIVTVWKPEPDAEHTHYDIAGPVCESTDTFAKKRPFPVCTAGDLVAIRSAGAYGAVMASEYNTRPLVPEVLVKGGQYAVIRPRPSVEQMIERDVVPPWV